MKFSPLHASLLALAVYSGHGAALGVALAAASETQTPMVVAQSESAGEAQDFEAVRKFLAHGRDVSQMEESQLRQRLKRAERLSRTEGLPPDLAGELQQQISALESEIAKRQQATESSSGAGQPEAQQQQQPQRKKQQQDAQQESQPEAQQQSQQQQQQQSKPLAQDEPSPSAAPAGGGDVAAFLQSVRPASELDDREIRRQVRRASELAKQKGLQPEQRQALRNVIREGRQALRNKGGNDQAQDGAVGSQQQQQATGQPESPQPQPQQPQAGQGTQQPDQAAQPKAKVNPALEQQAQTILNDKVDVRTMNRRDLRQRLSGIRDLLASGELSPQTAEALRRKLAEERSILRNEVAAGEGGNQQPQPQTQTGTPSQTRPGQSGADATGGGYRPPRDRDHNRSNGPNFDINIVLGDTRPPDALPDYELVRRIDVYRDVVADERYSEIERERWRRQMERDRLYLRERMLEERRQREARLRSGEVDFNVDVEDNYIPDRRVPRSVFAAEVEDAELADVLAAPPRRRIERRYTVDEIERSPEARDAVARIEIDTVHFGFGEGFLREEEIDKLDRIAQILEKILAKNPDEVFLLEGHTDAVGSDEANLQLSRERARAVKQALTTYYVIPAQNLKTVGLGERYLKIPTQQPEAENRRVSLARITPLVGQAQ